MNPQIVWTRRASEELQEVIAYVAVQQRSPEIAERLFDQFMNRIGRLYARNETGSVHPLAPDMRYVLHKRWLIFFRRDQDRLAILRVVDGSRDLPNIL